MKLILFTQLLMIVFFYSTFYGQNLNGHYYHSQNIIEPDGDYGILEIQLTSDSTYVQTAYIGNKNELKRWKKKWVRIVKKGKIKKEQEFYRFFENSKTKGHHVKIYKNELHFYVGHIGNGEISLVKGLVFVKNRINGKRVRNKRHLTN